MIKTQDLKLQMDELTKQNDMVLIELEQVKKMLGNNSQGSQSAKSTQSNKSDQNNQSAQSSQSDQDPQSTQTTKGSNAQPQAANDSGSQQVSDLANDLLKIKDLVEKLEQKTSQYVSSQSNGTLNEKDAVNLILTLMNGMVDWASEFVSSKASSNGQLQ